MKAKCFECAYKGAKPGDAHTRCKYDWSKSKFMMPRGNPHGIRHGWYMFPLNYDPVWMQEECQAFATEANPDMVKDKYDPLLELAALLR